LPYKGDAGMSVSVRLGIVADDGVNIARKASGALSA
jgi:hypothetical protein